MTQQPPGWYSDARGVTGWWDGQRWQYGPQPPRSTQPPELPKRRRPWLAGFIGLCIGLAIGGSVGAAAEHKSGGKNAAVSLPPVTSEPAPVTTAPAPSTAATVRVVLDQRGSGIKNTRQFHTSVNEWQIHYSYDCANFGSTGNFVIQVLGSGDAQADIAVNELRAKNSDSTFEHGAGTYYLSINSECDWRVRVVG